MSATLTVPGQRLPDLYTEMFAFVLQLSLASDPGDGQALRIQIMRILDTAKQQALAAGYSEQAIQATHYAVMALVDELILSSNWPLKGGWLGRPLQLEHYGSFNAGEEFFTRLESIKASQDPQRAEVLEVYTLCLWLGFKGKFGGVQGMETLRKLRASLIEELAATPVAPAPSQSVAVSARDQAIGRSRRKTNPKDLSPAWRAPGQTLQMPKDPPVRPVLVACLALTVLVYALLAGLLSSSVSSVVSPG